MNAERVRHLVINKLLDIEYHRKHLLKYIQSGEPNYEKKQYHLEEIKKRALEIENWLNIEGKNETREI